jgi:hypothetical protein
MGGSAAARHGRTTGASVITLERRRSAALLYHVLAHLDLGRDAASLHDPSLPRRAWVDDLRRAYGAAPGRLVVHAIALVHADASAVLRDDPPPGLRDAEGRELAHHLADALDAEAPHYEPTFADPPTQLLEPLATLRAALYERIGEPPPLTILDCPALRLAGRAATHDGTRVIAVSLAQDPGHVLCQTIHEEIHAVTDPVVREGFATAVRQDTRADAPGFALHCELERAAIEVGDALVAARTPQWSAAYARWRARFAAP